MFKFKTAARMKYISRIGMSLSALALVLILFFSYYGQNVGSFTIDLGKELRDKHMVISETQDFTDSDNKLFAKPIDNAIPIGIRGIPEAIPLEIDEISYFHDGSNNGINYFAYTFYTKNQGKEPLHYNLTLYINKAKTNIDAAIRVMIIATNDLDGEKIVNEEVYAKVQGDNGEDPGKPEEGTQPFFANKIIINENRFDFNAGMVDKYTIIMWLHGEDIDCTDIGDRSIKNGKLSMSMKFSIIA